MSTRKKIKSSLITINYNSSDKLLKLLKSIKKTKGLFDEIIIIDNNSKPSHKKIIKNLKNVNVIFNKKNVGFAKAANQGLKKCKNKIALLINPDCEFLDDTPKKTFEYISNSQKIAAIGGRLIDPLTNSIKFSPTTKPDFFTALFEFTNLKKIFPNNIYTKRFWVEKHNKTTRPIQVHSLCGAYIFIRKYDKCVFDERYFLYMEDLDFGDVLIQNNCEVWFDPRSHIRHIGGSSSASKYKVVLKHWYNSRKIYFNKHLPTYQSKILLVIFTLEEILLKLYHKLTHTQYE